MDSRKAFLFSGVVILAWVVFWHGALRIVALRRTANTGSPAARGLLVLV